MSTFTWAVSQMETQVSEGQLTDVVVTVHWNCTAVQNEYSAYVYGSCAIPLNPDAFIPYSQLTESEVLNWVWSNGVNKDETEASLQSQINGMITPEIVTLPLPWVSA